MNNEYLVRRTLIISVFILCSFSVAVLTPANAAKRKVHTIGDSTMSEYKPSATPKRGWGMYLQAFFNPDSVEVNNRGKSGASTRTFYETENLWPSVKAQMSAGDYLIIQFAHNDEKCKGEDVYVENARLRNEGKDTLTDMRGTEPNTTYKEYLRKYVNEARELGVKPILMSPICRAYFKDGKINDEGRHDLTARSDLHQPSSISKNYVQCMREIAEEMNVPFLDMTTASRALYELQGQEYCIAHYFNCGDKTHTSAEGGLMIASLASGLIISAPELTELQRWSIEPEKEAMIAYVQRIEDAGKQAALEAEGITVSEPRLIPSRVENMDIIEGQYYIAAGGAWPAGEIDEVANRYLEYKIEPVGKKGMVLEKITIPVRVTGGEGMNLHVNYGFGDTFKGVTTIYENTALPENEEYVITIEPQVLVPGSDTIHIRILPWYDSNGSPQKGKLLYLGEVVFQFKVLSKVREVK